MQPYFYLDSDAPKRGDTVRTVLKRIYFDWNNDLLIAL